MRISEDKTFQIMHSLNQYDGKEMSKCSLSGDGVKRYNAGISDPSKKIAKMAFVRSTMSVAEFAEAATSGHTFCNLFSYDENTKYEYEYWHNLKKSTGYAYPTYHIGKNKGAMKIQFKCESLYEGSQCFFVDIDYTDYEDVQGFIDTLKLKPTLTYLSYSDDILKPDKKQLQNPKYDHEHNGIVSRRFRLCYVFEDVVKGIVRFKQIGQAIISMIEESTGEEVEDKCGASPVQYFNGTIHKGTYVTNCIYTEEDFEPYISNVQDDVTEESCATETDEEPSHPIDIFHLPPIAMTDFQKDCNGKQNELSERLINLLGEIEQGNISYDDFMKSNRWNFRPVYRVDNGNWTNGYQVIDDSYFSLPYQVIKLQDGMKRRKKLYERMCLRRVICPNITANDVLYNAYEDLHRFIDNSEDPITIEDLVRNVNSAFNISIAKIEEQYEQEISFLKSKAPKHNLIFNLKGCKSQGERNIRMKESRWNYIDDNYDSSLSLKENAERMKISERTLRRYCESRSIMASNKISNEELKLLIDPSKSIAETVRELKEVHGIGVSKNRVSSIKKQLCSNIISC